MLALRSVQCLLAWERRARGLHLLVWERRVLALRPVLGLLVLVLQRD